MTALTRRLRRLEFRFAPPDDPGGRRLVELLRARIRRWAEVNGQTYAAAPPEDLTGMAVVDILRERFNRPVPK
jgi:hypothetical protein